MLGQQPTVSVRAVTQTVGHRSVAEKDWTGHWVSPCVVCCSQSDTGTVVSPATSVFPCQYHSTIAPYSFIHLPPTLYNVSLPPLQFSPVSTIPPLLHTHSFIYHPPCIMFFLPVLQFSPVSIISPLLHTHSFIYHPPCIMFFLPVLKFSPVSIISPLLHTHSFIYHPPCIMFFLPVLQFSPVSIISPLLHTHSSIYHPRCIMFLSQYFSFPLSVSSHKCYISISTATEGFFKRRI